jgi:DNA phosphorothioation-dependent restriction protein DptG
MAALQTVLDTFMKRKSQVINSHRAMLLSFDEQCWNMRKRLPTRAVHDYYNGTGEVFDNQSDADMGFVSHVVLLVRL